MARAIPRFLQRVPVHYAAEMSTDSGEFVNISRFVFVSGNFLDRNSFIIAFSNPVIPIVTTKKS
jgi:hypothetical protein